MMSSTDALPASVEPLSSNLPAPLKSFSLDVIASNSDANLNAAPTPTTTTTTATTTTPTRPGCSGDDAIGKECTPAAVASERKMRHIYVTTTTTTSTGSSTSSHDSSTHGSELLSTYLAMGVSEHLVSHPGQLETSGREQARSSPRVQSARAVDAEGKHVHRQALQVTELQPDDKKKNNKDSSSSDREASRGSHEEEGASDADIQRDLEEILQLQRMRLLASAQQSPPSYPLNPHRTSTREDEAAPSSSPSRPQHTTSPQYSPDANAVAAGVSAENDVEHEIWWGTAYPHKRSPSLPGPPRPPSFSSHERPISTTAVASGSVRSGGHNFSPIYPAQPSDALQVAQAYPHALPQPPRPASAAAVFAPGSNGATPNIPGGFEGSPLYALFLAQLQYQQRQHEEVLRQRSRDQSKARPPAVHVSMERVRRGSQECAAAAAVNSDVLPEYKSNGSTFDSSEAGHSPPWIAGSRRTGRGTSCDDDRRVAAGTNGDEDSYDPDWFLNGVPRVKPRMNGGQAHAQRESRGTTAGTALGAAAAAAFAGSEGSSPHRSLRSTSYETAPMARNMGAGSGSIPRHRAPVSTDVVLNGLNSPSTIRNGNDEEDVDALVMDIPPQVIFQHRQVTPPSPSPSQQRVRSANQGRGASASYAHPSAVYVNGSPSSSPAAATATTAAAAVGRMPPSTTDTRPPIEPFADVLNEDVLRNSFYINSASNSHLFPVPALDTSSGGGGDPGAAMHWSAAAPIHAAGVSARQTRVPFQDVAAGPKDNENAEIAERHSRTNSAAKHLLRLRGRGGRRTASRGQRRTRLASQNARRTGSSLVAEGGGTLTPRSGRTGSGWREHPKARLTQAHDTDLEHPRQRSGAVYSPIVLAGAEGAAGTNRSLRPRRSSSVRIIFHEPTAFDHDENGHNGRGPQGTPPRDRLQQQGTAASSALRNRSSPRWGRRQPKHPASAEDALYREQAAAPHPTPLVYHAAEPSRFERMGTAEILRDLKQRWAPQTNHQSQYRQPYHNKRNPSRHTAKPSGVTPTTTRASTTAAPYAADPHVNITPPSREHSFRRAHEILDGVCATSQGTSARQAVQGRSDEDTALRASQQQAPPQQTQAQRSSTAASFSLTAPSPFIAGGLIGAVLRNAQAEDSKRAKEKERRRRQGRHQGHL